MSITPAPRASVSCKLAFLNSHFSNGVLSPLDRAILDHGGVDATGWKKLDEVPFDYQRRRVSLLLETKRRALAHRQGRPRGRSRRLLRATRRRRATSEPSMRQARARILDLFHQLSGEGFRVLAVAFRPIEAGKTEVAVADESGAGLRRLCRIFRSAEGERRRNGARSCRPWRRPENPDRRRRAGDAPRLRRARHSGDRSARRQGARRACRSRRCSRGSSAPTSSFAWSRRTSGV